MQIFVLNCGSSSVKYKLFHMKEGHRVKEGHRGDVLAAGRVERIGTEQARIVHEGADGEAMKKIRPIYEHREAIALILDTLFGGSGGNEQRTTDVAAVGHRVVHGGELFRESVLVTEAVKNELVPLNDLAPLHNPHNIAGIEACQTLLPDVPQVAVFDTALHAGMPPHAFLYALPYELYERHHVRRYGFHGISHQYVAQRVALLMQKPLEQLRIISCHLGAGASIAAIRNGRSVDTSMGFTPLEGLMMGTRSGDVDPGALIYLMAQEDMGVNEMSALLNRHSGLQGISGVGGDMRDVEEAVLAGDAQARLAFDMYEYRVRKYIGAYAAAMNGVDAIAFTAGIGERSPLLRAQLGKHLTYIGAHIDAERNTVVGEEAEISAADTSVRLFVVPTDEEQVIAQNAATIVKSMRQEDPS